MARYASIGTMLAATALISWPVLAQTTGTGPAARAAGTAARHDIQPHHHDDNHNAPGHDLGVLGSQLIEILHRRPSGAREQGGGRQCLQ